MGPSKQILLVDDEVDFLFSAGLSLRKAGFQVGAADNARAAFAMILEAYRNSNPYDLLVTDIRMPGMSGLELIDAVKRYGPKIATVAITCFFDADQIGELNVIGCDGVFEKPFAPDELVERIRGILEFLRQPVS